MLSFQMFMICWNILRLIILSTAFDHTITVLKEFLSKWSSFFFLFLIRLRFFIYLRIIINILLFILIYICGIFLFFLIFFLFFGFFLFFLLDFLIMITTRWCWLIWCSNFFYIIYSIYTILKKLRNCRLLCIFHYLL